MASKDRFATVVTKYDIMQAIQSRTPNKTLQTTKWAYGIWNSWCNISDELTQMTASRMDDVSQFIMEARRQDSEVYPPKTLFQIIASLQCHLYLRENGRPEIAIIFISQEKRLMPK